MCYLVSEGVASWLTFGETWDYIWIQSSIEDITQEKCSEYCSLKAFNYSAIFQTA